MLKNNEVICQGYMAKELLPKTHEKTVCKYLSQISSLESLGSDELFTWLLKELDWYFRVTI